MAYHYEIYQDRAGEFRVRFKNNSEVMFSSEGYVSKQSALNAIESFKRHAADADEQDSTLDYGEQLKKLQSRIDSTDWTGLGKRITPAQSKMVREKSKALLSAIIQSDADIETRNDACKRVEAVILLLEAPNAPWREIVSLLNHPSVTAFLAALNLIQFLVSLAT